MFFNSIITAFRNIAKNNVTTTINLTGLSVGLTCVIIILAYIRHEITYDKFHADHELIFRITTDWTHDGTQEHSAISFSPLATILQEHVHEIKSQARILPHTGLIGTEGKPVARENKFCFVDSTIFDVLTFQALKGNLAHALRSPYSVVLTESAALHHFGSVDAVGKELQFEDSRQKSRFNVTAVVKDLPSNSHFHANYLASFTTLKDLWSNALRSWHYPPVYHYIKLASPQPAESLNRTINSIAQQHVPDYVKDENRTFIAQPLANIHLTSALANEWENNSSYAYITTFSVIGIFILLIACINFMNLSTVVALSRLKEVGIRKAIGSQRSELIMMFMLESVMIGIASLLIAYGVSEMVAPFIFEMFITSALSVRELLLSSWSLYLIFGTIGLSVLTGLYPALWMSSVKAVDALKQKIAGTGPAISGLRKALIVVQFTISVVLLAGVIVIQKQYNFLMSKDLGYQKENLLAITLTDTESQVNIRRFIDKLKQYPFVLNASSSATLPSLDNFHGWEIKPEGFNDKPMNIKTVNADHNFISTYGIKIVAGRDFKEDIESDKTKAFIINRAAQKKFGWQDAIGKEMELVFYSNKEEIRNGKVIGVVEDFHYQSLYNSIEPLVFFINTHQYYTDFLTINLKAGDIKEQVAKLTDEWDSFSGHKPFEFSFVDENVNQAYMKEARTNAMLSVFSGLSVFVSCLGLFGLISFSIEKRRKEVGIRKVLGSGTIRILTLLAKETFILVAVAGALAVPVAWHFSNEWLSQFAYHVSTGFSPYLLSFMLILTIAMFTIALKIVRAVSANPIKSLRDE